MKSRSKASRVGDTSPLILYIRFTCAREKEKRSCESLSPIQKTPQSDAAMRMPKRTVVVWAPGKLLFVPILSFPPKAKAKHISTIAEAAIQTQKFMWGDVKGENMMNHSKAATSRLRTSRLLSRHLSGLCVYGVSIFNVQLMRALIINPMASVKLKASCNFAVASSKPAIASKPFLW